MPPDSPDRWEALSRVLDAVLDLPTGERAEYLDRHVPDLVLRREAEAYLAYEGNRAPALDATPTQRRALFQSALGQNPTGLLRTGDEVGPYRIVRLLGSGGAGEVYAATDVEAGKTVALKVLRGASLPEIRERLRREYRALARLDHQAIVRYLAQGETPAGTPYFVMEHVEGEAVTDYVEKRRLPVPERLHLLEAVAEAVQHAHERLVLHRDLKPSNVLVTERDGRPTVKVVDFGIGKVLDEEETGGHSLPSYHRLTPAYAAPEQLRSKPATAATDVYTLGVLGYELLTGQRAHPTTETCSLDEIAQRIETLPPAAPSAVAPTGIAPSLRGDLDAILLKALRADPAERYPTARAFGEDLRRFRQHQPVAARRGGRWYRTALFLRRHVPAGLVVLTGLLGSSAYAVGVTQARNRAQHEARTASEVTSLLTSLFDAADPYNDDASRFDTMRVRPFVAQSAARLLQSPPADPEVRGRLLCTLARVRTSLGDYDGAGPLFERCLHPTVSRGDMPEWQAVAFRERSILAREQGNYAAALYDAHTSVAQLRRLHGPEHTEVALSLSRLADVYLLRSRLDSAEASYREALRIYRAKEGETSLLTAAGYTDLGVLLTERAQYDEAIALHERALAIQRRQLGNAHVSVGKALQNLGAALSEGGQYARADSVLREAHRVLVAALGPDNPATVTPLMDVGVVYARNDRYEDALHIAEQVFAFRQRVQGPNHPATLQEYSNLGRIYTELGRFDEAIRMLTTGLNKAQRALGPENETTLMTGGNLAFTYISMKQGAPAERVLREILPAWDHAYGREHPMTAMTRVGLVDALLLQERAAEAESIAREALASLQKTLPPEHPQVLNARSRLGKTLYIQRLFREAEVVLRERFTIAERAYEPGHAQRMAAARALAELYTRWRRPAEVARYRALAELPPP